MTENQIKINNSLAKILIIILLLIIVYLIYNQYKYVFENFAYPKILYQKNHCDHNDNYTINNSSSIDTLLDLELSETTNKLIDNLI
jgi:hypothetical protein